MATTSCPTFSVCESPQEIGDQMWCGNPKNRKIGFGIIADAICTVLLAVRERDTDFHRVMDDVAVGKNEAIRSEYES